MAEMLTSRSAKLGTGICAAIPWAATDAVDIVAADEECEMGPAVRGRLNVGGGGAFISRLAIDMRPLTS